MGTGKAGSFAFIKIGSFSHSNEHVLQELQARFPDLRPTVIDVGDIRVVRKLHTPRLALAVASEYGLAACASPSQFRRHIMKTRYWFLRARELLRQRLSQESFAFTFQTQSLFDASQPGTPHFVYTDHTHLANLSYPEPSAATLVSRSWAELERQVYQNASVVFTMSRNIARSVVEQYQCTASRVECVYAGSNVSAAAGENIDISRFEAKNILFVGVDWERKGGPVLLDAFRLLRRTHPDARLTIVGCSPSISEKGVRVVGRVPLEDVAQHYRSATVFCLPTLNEPLGLVFLEAFSYGVPVVATDIGAIDEIVADGRSGYLVPPHDSAALASSLGRLIENPEQCERFGVIGRRHVAERYSWERTGERLADRIERVAQLKPRTRPERQNDTVLAPTYPVAV